MFSQLWNKYRQNRLRKTYREGVTISRFLAPDVRREVTVIDAAEIEDGFITASVRTVNVLHVINGLTEEPGFCPPERLEIAGLWEWNGEL